MVIAVALGVNYEIKNNLMKKKAELDGLDFDSKSNSESREPESKYKKRT